MTIYYQQAAVISAALRGDRLKRIVPVWNGVNHEMTGKACNSDEDRVRREETRDRSADNCMRAENQSCGPAFGTSARVMVNDTPIMLTGILSQLKSGRTSPPRLPQGPGRQTAARGRTA